MSFKLGNLFIELLQIFRGKNPAVARFNKQAGDAVYIRRL